MNIKLSCHSNSHLYILSTWQSWRHVQSREITFWKVITEKQDVKHVFLYQPFLFPLFQSYKNFCKTSPLYICNFFITTAYYICPSFTLNIGVPLMQLQLHSPVLQFLTKPPASHALKLGMSLIYEVLQNSIPCLHACSLFSSLSDPFIHSACQPFVPISAPT